jgi:ribosomal protein L11 methyltransferase
MSQRQKTATPGRKAPEGSKRGRGKGGKGESQRTGGTALWELRVTVTESIGDEVGALLIENGAGGVVEEPAGRRVRLVTFGERWALERLASTVSGALGSRARAEVRPASASLDGWDTAWMQSLVPVAISKSLTLVPTNAAFPEAGHASVVRLEPALTFGFGEHPTTRLAARAVERWCRAGAVKTVLDVGTGSGVLALVAAVSGARRVVGIDVHSAAVHAAKRNAALNGVETACRFSSTPLARLRSHFDLVVANLDRGTLLTHRASLHRALAPRGTLLMTGFLSGDAVEIERSFAALGLVAGSRKREADWVLVTLSRA